MVVPLTPTPSKSGLIYYLAKLAIDVTGTGETTMGGWVGKVEKKGSSPLGESPDAVGNKTKHEVSPLAAE